MMKILAGLGNPGPKYINTRHNAGFMVIDYLAQKLACNSWRQGFLGFYAHTLYQGEKVILLKPQTFMNESGRSLVQLAHFYNVDWSNVLVLYDDMDLLPGQVRVRSGGTAGGHKGMESILAASGREDIPRIKLGIGRSPFTDDKDFVLSCFTKEEGSLIDAAISRAADASLLWIGQGLQKAMNSYNSVSLDPKGGESVEE